MLASSLDSRPSSSRPASIAPSPFQVNTGPSPDVAQGHVTSLIALLASSIQRNEVLYTQLIDELRKDQGAEEVNRDRVRKERRGSVRRLGRIPEIHAAEQDAVSAAANPATARVKSEPVELDESSHSSIAPVSSPRIVRPKVDLLSRLGEPAYDGAPHGRAYHTSDAVAGGPTSEETRFARGRLTGFPSPFETIDLLPPSYSTYQAGRNGNLFTCMWVFPLPGSDDAIIVSDRSHKTSLDKELLDSSHQKTSPIEVVFQDGLHGTLTYLGSFMPEGGWLPFNDDNIHGISTLLDFWTRVADPARVDHLRRRSEMPARGSNKLFYALLKHVRFNDEYFAALEAFTAETRASSRSAQSHKRRRSE